MTTLPVTPLPPTVPTLRVTDLHAESRPDAIGITETRPRLSWRTETCTPAWAQHAYRIQAFSRNGDVMGDTGRIESAESVLVAWPFVPLQARERRSIRLQVWGSDGHTSEFSEALVIEAGLLNPQDWTAQFITPAWDEDTTQPQPSPLLRREFHVASRVKCARLYITALGVYELYLNGQNVSPDVLAPGWTSYRTRLRYQTYDVTDLIQDGANAIGALLGDGWYRGRLGFGGGKRNIYGDRLALLAQLELEYEDGRTEHVVSDEKWRATTGPVLATDLYDGETYDARLEQSAWTAPHFNDQTWRPVRILTEDFTRLTAPEGPPVRRTELLEPKAIFTSPSGKTLVDFGQNLVGWLRISVQGEAGHTVTLQHAEVLEHGELGTRPLRFAAATDRYTLKGGGIENWEPRFTFHGFRYAQIDNWPGELRPEDIRAVVVHSDLERTGWFECSDPLINQLHQNVVWGMRGNFLAIPTDCPQRDERLGWTGDIQVFAPTASFLYNVRGFLSSWLKDLAADQEDTGAVPAVIPHVLAAPLPAAAWGDAATVVPWVLYQRYGDKGVLEEQFSSMKAWVDYVHSRTGPSLLWDQDFQFGDWLDPAAPPTNPADGRTNPSVVATAYFVRSAELVANTASILGRKDDATHYQQLANDVRAAFEAEYVTANGRIISDSSTAYALAVQFTLLRGEKQRTYAGRRLRALVRENGYRIGTGFVGTPLICDALCSVGEYDAAYRLLTQTECPSWLYPVTMGATTIWERWDSMLPDGSINPGEMTSFNHYALGAVADWLHRTVAGLAPGAGDVGYRRLDIHPVPGGRLTSARAQHITPYGLAESSWEIQEGQFKLHVVVPPNTTADVTLPSGEVHHVASGTYNWTVPYQASGTTGPVTLESDFDTLSSHPELYQNVIQAVQAHSADHLDGFRKSLQSSLAGTSIQRAVWGIPHREELLQKLEQLLMEQSA
ncbi:glycoside hydrolase family 78 protein [Deinococcus alpinitundrae]|uniref:glycoside hydrolase family 78 protein n=1 Tax=Deinococcus alpinitundrae TaxID=468913 RepID=UPI00137AAA5F|nr:glycoside hydrolase family 78 protein [Deinococcus alpinitundrae]